MTPDDGVLVERARAGDGNALETLLIRYETRIFNVALRMVGNREDARDVAQSVMLKVVSSLDGFDAQFKFFSWIYRIAVNESLNFLGRRRPTTPLAEVAAARSEEPDGAAETAERRRAVQQALMTLSADYRAVVVLRHYLGASYAEIATTVGVPEKTVKSRLYTARQLLREQFARQGLLEV